MIVKPIIHGLIGLGIGIGSILLIILLCDFVITHPFVFASVFLYCISFECVIFYSSANNILNQIFFAGMAGGFFIVATFVILLKFNFISLSFLKMIFEMTFNFI